MTAARTAVLVLVILGGLRMSIVYRPTEDVSRLLLWDRYKEYMPCFWNILCNDSEGCDIFCTKEGCRYGL